MINRTDTSPTLPAESPELPVTLRVAAVSADDGLRVEVGHELLAADQARRLAADLLEAADRISA